MAASAGSIAPSPATEADLLQTPRDGTKYELVDGTIRMSPAGYRHGRISVRLAVAMERYATERRLGELVDSSTGFRLPGGNVRCPDLAFVRRERVPQGEAAAGFADFAPDLAVEVLSPGDDARNILDKVGEYLQAGVRLVWVIDPRASRAAAYRSLTDVRQVTAEGELDGEDVVPGFRVKLSDLLA
jgi:Uma2 family endonuclease